MHLQITYINLLSRYKVFNWGLHELNLFLGNIWSNIWFFRSTCYFSGRCYLPHRPSLLLYILASKKIFLYFWVVPMSFIRNKKNKTRFLSLYLLIGSSFWWLSFQLWNYEFSLFLFLVPQYYLGDTEADPIGGINFNSIFWNLSVGPLRFGLEKNFKQISPFSPFWHTNFTDVGSTIVFSYQYYSFQNLYPFPLQFIF